MKRLNDINTTPTIDIKHSAIYKKALYIYELSQKLNKNYLTNTSSLSRSKVLEDFVLVSIKLPYTIALAQTTANYNTKLRSSNTILESIKRLKIHCEELKSIRLYNNKDITSIDKEIRNFTNLYLHWRLILTQQN